MAVELDFADFAEFRRELYNADGHAEEMELIRILAMREVHSQTM